MHRIATRLAPSRAPRVVPALRSIHLSAPSLATEPAHEPVSTQGHATKKAKQTLHKDGDVQSASVRAASDDRSRASANESGEDQPFDAARQGSEGGEKKGGGKASGPFADQVGGQDEADKGPGVVMGGREEAPTGKTFDRSVKESLSGFAGLKQLREDQKNFSTSARAYNSSIPRTDADGSRQPKDKDVKGEQNSHLKHTEGGSQGKPGQGNAAPDPSLPSKKSAKSSGSSTQQTRSFSTSLRALADPNAPGVDTPHSAQKESRVQGGARATPGGSQTAPGGNAGTPSQPSGGAPESTPQPTTGSGAPDPGIPKDQRQGAHREGMGVDGKRPFSTSSRVLADPNAPGVDAPLSAQKDARVEGGARGTPSGGENTGLGGHAGGPSQPSGGMPDTTPNAPAGTGAPDPGVPKEDRKGAHRDGMGIHGGRKFSTSSRVAATQPPSRYAKAHEPEPAAAGYKVPPEALPSKLKSSYEEHDPKATEAAPSNLKPSSKIPYSSTAQDPPNEALRKAALDGTLASRNPQPTAEMGEQGLGEAWKHRKQG